ncbi:MAG: hypothetical protein HYU56_01000 [Candidatus Aenigmarchaeota archaeon]|nr:hypothetical protein [Candidatus Aenigmarchaeota archaeon]
MKGQNIIIGEILLFAIGIAIANYVIFSFQKAQDKTTEIAIKDNFRAIANTVSAAAAKAVESGNISVRIQLPEKMSGRQYSIYLKNDYIVVFDLLNSEINVTQKLFNITQENCISDNAFCAKGDVVSTARIAEIRADGKNIVLRRLRIL